MPAPWPLGVSPETWVLWVWPGVKCVSRLILSRGWLCPHLRGGSRLTWGKSLAAQGGAGPPPRGSPHPCSPSLGPRHSLGVALAALCSPHLGAPRVLLLLFRSLSLQDWPQTLACLRGASQSLVSLQGAELLRTKVKKREDSRQEWRSWLIALCQPVSRESSIAFLLWGW